MWDARGPFLPAVAMVGMVVLVNAGRCRLMSHQPTVGIIKIVNGSK